MNKVKAISRFFGFLLMAVLVTFTTAGDVWAQNCTFGKFGPNSMPSSCWTPHSKTISPFNARLPSNPKLYSQSATIVSRMVSDGLRGQFEAPYGVRGATNNYLCNHPLYFSSSSDPIVTVQSCSTYGSAGMAVPKQIHVPANARPNLGCTDHHIAIIDQSTSEEYDFYQGFSIFGYPNGGVITSGGCGSVNVQTGTGIGPAVTAPHFAVTSGIIRGQEMQDGVINHALFVVTSCDAGVSVFPSTYQNFFPCTNRTGAPPLGALFWLDYTDAQIAAMNLPPWKKAIITAMAHYGAYVGDQGGPSTSVFLSTMVEGGEQYYVNGKPQPMQQVAQAQGVPYNSGLNGYIFDATQGLDLANHLHVVDPCVPLGLTGQPGGCANPLSTPTPTPAPAPSPSPSTVSTTGTTVSALYIVNNSAGGQRLMSLTSGLTIDLTKLPTQNINVEATVASTSAISKVVFQLDTSISHTEAAGPYALCGDWTACPTNTLTALGTHTLTVTPFNGAGAQGTPLKVTFSVIKSTTTVTTFKAGETNILGTVDNGNANLLLAQQMTLSQSATIQSLSFYVGTASGSLILGIYDATGSGGGPGILKAHTNSFTPVSGWNTQPVTTQVVLPAGTYWLAYLPSSNSLSFRKTYSGQYKMRSYPFGPMPSSFGTPAAGEAVHWSFYGTFAP